MILRGKLYYETIYYNKDQDRVTRKEYEGTGGGWDITEEYRDSGGVFSKREGTYGKGKTYEEANWGGQCLDLENLEIIAKYLPRQRESVSGKEKWDYSKPVSSPCWPLWNLASGPCVKYLVSNLFYLVFSGPVIIWFISPARFFDTAIVFSISGQAMDTSANSMIAVGWTTIRDLINLFFIFILLYAAISTILQYGDYQLKNVLAKIIIAALLINFSLMIGKMVIDASHILAWEFYNRIDVNDTANEVAKAAKKDVEEELGETEKLFPEVKGDINVKIEEGIIFGPRKLSEVFLAGFNPQRLIIASTGGRRH